MNDVGKVTLSNQDLRENFKVAAMMLARANNIAVDKVKLSDLTQGFLRSPIDLTVSMGVLQFPITTLDQVTGAPQIPLTNLVASVDAFVAGQMGYYLMIYSFSGGSQANIDFTGPNRFGPVTYPSPFDNNGSGTNWSQGCIMFWYGFIKIEINSKILYKAWDLMRHLKVPRTQATPAVGVTPSPQLLVLNEFDGGTDAFYPMEPLPVFSGSKQNIVQMFLPANIPNSISPFNLGGVGYGTAFIAKAVCHWRGVTCQNASGLK